METPIEPTRVPSINLSGEEIEDIKAQMADGRLPMDFLKRHYEAVEKNVFGFDHRKDRHGRPIEQGIGAPGRETANYYASLKKAESAGLELPGTYDRAVAELVKGDPDRARRLNLVRGV